MKRRVWRWALGIGCAIAVSLVAAVLIGAFRKDADLRDQLRLARQEGIPMTAAEFAARIKPVPPEQNAAALYRKLHPLGANLPTNLADYCPVQPAALARDKAFIASSAGEYAIVDQAVKRPHCWFDRDWNKGFGILFPEYASMKDAAKLLMIRGWVEVDRGDAQAAAAEVKKLFVIGRHLDEDPTLIAYYVHLVVLNIAATAVSSWSIEHRNEPAYVKLLGQIVDEIPKPDLRRLYAGEFYALLQAIDETGTVEGRRDFGLKDDEGPSFYDRTVLKLASGGKGKADIVRSFREAWAAFPKLMDTRDIELRQADFDLDQALLAFPYAYQIFGSLGFDKPWESDPEALWMVNRERVIALERALSQNPIPRSIKADDLPSPYNRKRLGYSFDGRQIVITTSPAPSDNDDEAPKPLVYKVPPDSAFK